MNILFFNSCGTITYQRNNFAFVTVYINYYSGKRNILIWKVTHNLLIKKISWKTQGLDILLLLDTDRKSTDSWFGGKPPLIISVTKSRSILSYLPQTPSPTFPPRALLNSTRTSSCSVRNVDTDGNVSPQSGGKNALSSCARPPLYIRT